MEIPIYKGPPKTSEELPSLIKGRYAIKFDIPSPFENLILNKVISLPGGKKVLIEKIQKTNDGKTDLYINIIENPIPLALIIGTLGSVALGFLIWKIVIEVRKIIDIPFEKSKNLLPLALVGLAGLALWKFSS